MQIEFISKESTIKNIFAQWVAAGKFDNTEEGSFIFCDVDDYEYNSGCVIVEKGDDTYIYNVSDFYRIKITDKS